MLASGIGRIALTLAVLLPSAGSMAAGSVAADARDAVGRWTGTLEAGAASLRLRFVITAADGEQLAVTMDSIDQGASGIPGTIETTADGVAISIPSIRGGYVGTFDTDGGALVGTWSQLGREFPLTLVREAPGATDSFPAAAALDGQPHGPELPGTWLGDLAVGAMVLRLQFNVREVDGMLDVTLDSIDQGARGIRCVAELRPDRAVAFRAPSVGGRFDGVLNAAADTLAGTWSQGGRTLPLVLARTGGPVNLDRPQEPRPPLPYRAVEVGFPGGAEGVELAGTLTIPDGAGPFPAVILVSGSGPQDRNEELMGHKPFLVLADHLTRSGIAVLRYDDRGTAQSTGTFAGATSADFAADAEAAFTFLKARPEVRPDAVGIVGHSEGGLIAPMVAARRDDVAFVVLLAGPGVVGSEILLRQTELMLRAAGETPDQVADERRLVEAALAALATLPDTAATPVVRERMIAAMAAVDGLDLGPDEIGQVVDRFADPWLRAFLVHDPAPDLEALRCPVLALNGSLDLQVDPDQNLPAIEAALTRGGNADHETRRLEGLNHLFQTAETGALAEYSQIEETFAPAALDAISAWIVSRFSAR